MCCIEKLGSKQKHLASLNITVTNTYAFVENPCYLNSLSKSLDNAFCRKDIYILSYFFLSASCFIPKHIKDVIHWHT